MPLPHVEAVRVDPPAAVVPAAFLASSPADLGALGAVLRQSAGEPPSVRDRAKPARLARAAVRIEARRTVAPGSAAAASPGGRDEAPAEIATADAADDGLLHEVASKTRAVWSTTSATTHSAWTATASVGSSPRVAPDPVVPALDTARPADGDEARGRGPSRQADATRRALVDAAAEAFAEHGFEAASVRVITAAAGVNQGAITYHFGGKDGLYRAVLKAARDSMGAQPLLTSADVDRLPLAETIRLFIRQTLAPLADGERAKLFLRVFAWEQLRPTDVRRKLSAESPFPIVVLAERIVRRVNPGADRLTTAVATAWLVAQVVTFVRDGEFLSRPPFDLTLDGEALDGLVERLAALCLGGLSASAGSSP